MISEPLVGQNGPDIVGAIFKRLGRTGQKNGTTPERFVIGGRIKQVEIARRTFALDADGRLYCFSWDDDTAFVGIAVSKMHGSEVMVHARANIIGLHAESITAVEHLEGGC